MKKGYIGLTDLDWHSFLRRHTRVDEVNFWQPHDGRTFRAIGRGEPFFFKLRAPHKAIAGFGFFERYESLPAWLAWGCFGEMNGAPDFDAMVDRICRLRRDDDPSARSDDFQIGCIMLSAPVFFGEDEWVEPPSDWARTGIQQGRIWGAFPHAKCHLWIERQSGGSNPYQGSWHLVKPMPGDPTWNLVES